MPLVRIRKLLPKMDLKIKVFPEDVEKIVRAS